MSTFDQAIPIILQHEGGWVNAKNDRGGETNFGISLNMIVRSLGLQPADLGLPNFDPGCMKLLTKDKAIEIYRKYFWEAYHLDQIQDQNSATKVLDAIVNMGGHWGVKCAQRAAGATDDGLLGPNTFAAINATANFEDAMASAMHQRYQDIITANPSQAVFQRTWFLRAGCTSTNRCICHPK